MTHPRSITLRLTLLFSAASTLVLLLVGALTVVQVEQHFEALDQEALDGKLLLIEHTLAKLSSPSELDRLGPALDELLIGHEHLAVAVIGPDRRPLVALPAAAFSPESLDRAASLAGRAPRTTFEWGQAGQRYRGTVATQKTALAELPALTVLAGLSTEPHHEFIASFARSLSWSVFGAVVLIAMLSWLAARHGLAPLDEMARVAKHISAEHLDGRLPVETVPPELLELTHAFNDMLARLQDSFTRLSEFSSDLAHELRTPLSNVMTQTQVALSNARSADEYREVLYSHLEETEKLSRMVSEMLYLAKADNGLVVPGVGSVDLATEVQALFSFYEALADESGVGLHLLGAGSVSGDRSMLHRAISNLLSNAIRHTARGGTIMVRIDRSATDAIELSVENPGPDIAPEHLPRLFDRFYRVDLSRRHANAGAGLGLAIARSIVRAHGGTLAVTSRQGLTRFVVTFPRRQSATPNMTTM